MDEWALQQMAEAIYFRTRNTMSWSTLKLGDDDKDMQNHQIEQYKDEVRSGINRIQEFGISTMPLPGAHGVTFSHGGQRSLTSIVGTDDPRYRPKGLKPGEQQGYIVDEAKKDGTDGKLRLLWQGLLDWKHKLFGKTIEIGSDEDTETITITSKTKIVIKAPEIVLDASSVIKLGGEDAATPASMQGTIDSGGDTDVGNFATRVRMK